MMNNNDNKDIKFTGDPVAFDGVEGKRDPKTGKGRFDLIPEEVFGPLFDRVHKLETTEPYMVDCTPASILNDIANENMLDAIIKITILKYYNTDSAIDAMCCQIEAGAFLECCWDMFLDLAIHFQKGAEHYGERNCQKGIPLWSFKDSAMRHAAQTFAGKTDEPHTISVVWNCWMAAWTVITSDKKDDTDKSSFEMALKISRDRRKNAKKALFNTPSDSPEFKEKKSDIDETKKIIEELVHLSSELEIPVVTAQQTSYTREEVEAIKKEAADKAIEDFLKDPDYYSKTMTALCRCSTDALMRELYKRLVVINKSGNFVKHNFVVNNREKLTKLTHIMDAIKRCDVDSERTVDTVEIQRIIHQLKEELRKARNIFADTDGKCVQVFFNQLRPAMNDMIAMWNSIAPMLLKDKTSEQ